MTDEGVPLAAACLHPHPALRATFPRLGEGFSGGGKVSAKNKSICNENAVFLKFRKRCLQMLFVLYKRGRSLALKIVHIG